MTAADRPSVTDNARAEAERHYPALNADDEALTYPRSAVREHARGGFVKGYEAGWAAALAAGRAETTTATTEDAQTGTFEAILAAHRDEYDSDCGMYFGCSCGWDNDDIGSNEGYVEHVAGLLATARTRPTRDDLARAIASGCEPDHPTPNRHDYRAADAVLALLEGGDDQ